MGLYRLPCQNNRTKGQVLACMCPFYIDGLHLTSLTTIFDDKPCMRCTRWAQFSANERMHVSSTMAATERGSIYHTVSYFDDAAITRYGDARSHGYTTTSNLTPEKGRQPIKPIKSVADIRIVCCCCKDSTSLKWCVHTNLHLENLWKRNFRTMRVYSFRQFRSHFQTNLVPRVIDFTTPLETIKSIMGIANLSIHEENQKKRIPC